MTKGKGEGEEGRKGNRLLVPILHPFPSLPRWDGKEGEGRGKDKEEGKEKGERK